MSITRTERIPCACGAPLEVTVADSLNAGRHPHLKQAILDRTLHLFTCGACGRSLLVEKDLCYFDFDRRQFFCTYPHHERARATELAAEVKRAHTTWMLERAPGFVTEYGKGFLVRVCFGYEELREKIVIDDAGLSDLVVEALKMDVLSADPWFEQSQVITLRLDTVLPDGSLYMRPEWIEPPSTIAPRSVTIARSLYVELDRRFDDILAARPWLAKDAHVSLLRLVDWPARAAAPAASSSP
jgi:hypothetical protein